MQIDRMPLKISDQIILHLLNFGSYKEKYKVPFQVSQAGIANILGAHRSHISYYLKKMESGDVLTSRLGRIQSLPRKRKVYFLTKKGEEQGQSVLRELIKEGMKVKSKGKEYLIEINDDTFNCQKTSFLERLIEKVESVIIAKGDSSEGAVKYVLDDCWKNLDPAYRTMLTKRNLRKVQRAIDKGNIVTVYAEDAPELLNVYLTVLARELSKICNVMVYDLHKFTTIEEVTYRFSEFLGKTGDYNLQRILEPGIYMSSVWREAKKIISGLPFVIIIRGEWSENVKNQLKEGLTKLGGKDVPMIIGVNDKKIPGWFKKTGIEIDLKPLSKSMVTVIYKELSAKSINKLGNMEKKYLHREASTSPLFIELFSGKDKRDEADRFKIDNDNYYASQIDGLEQELLDMLAAMAWMRYPILREQMKETDALKLDQLAESQIVSTTVEGFRLPTPLRNVLRKTMPAKKRSKHALDLYERMVFLLPYQFLSLIVLYMINPRVRRAIMKSCDLSILVLDRPEFPSLIPFFSDINRTSLSKETYALLLTLEGFHEFYRGKMKKAIELSREATRLGEQLKSEIVLSRSYLLQGNINLLTENHMKALENIVTSFNLFRSLDNTMGISLSSLLIAEIFSQMDEYNKALSYIDIAAEADRSMSLAPLIASVYAKRGELYEKKKMYSRAAQSFGEATELAARTGDTRKSLDYLLGKGDVLLKDGHEKEAISTFESVAEEAEERGFGELQINAYERLYTKCFPKGTTRYVRYKSKAGQLRVLLEKKRKKSRRK